MTLFKPVTQPAGVGVAGVTVTIPVTAGFHAYPVTRIIIIKSVGSATTLSWELSSDSAVADKLLTVASGTGATMPVDELATGSGLPWESQDGNLYLKLTPNNDATPNDFSVGVHILRGFK